MMVWDYHVINQWGDSDDIIDQKKKIQEDINNIWPWILTFNTVICNVKFLVGQSILYPYGFSFREEEVARIGFGNGKS